ncbi:hypothetical protein QJS10_CPA05g02004 [Acorus calamus]|uniref:GPI inositol-deacylase n=1 Tax=Acorus calamus TaxID=4465 RepID=A0AAV9EQ50_ACOCL|nr:hypothetical protein QJS10_CPA05g02004 [Acorus calamus]
MENVRGKCRVSAIVILSVLAGLGALYGLLGPVPNGCVMTYMYPTYIPIPTPPNVSSEKYGLFLYHEGWKKIDFNEHLKKLSGVPVLFIPGNGGSYKQVRSLAAESARAYQGGPPERTYYQEASFSPDDEGMDVTLENLDDISLPYQYTHMLDWFAVDLEGEHSAMDGHILEEHTEYVVYAIHRVLDQYQTSHNARMKEGAEPSGSLPTSVILVGHSMGGFVARAALVHPHLRKSAVETILTLSSPHQSPPIALQPSLGHFYSHVNKEWRKGYEIQTTNAGQLVSYPAFSRVVVVSISGGIRDYQVRSKFASLDGIVPSSHGFTLSSSSMKNVWLSTEHQSILWCNQVVVQISHTLLSIIDSKTGHPFQSTRKRLALFTKMLRSGMPQSFNWMKHAQQLPLLKNDPLTDRNNAAGPQIASYPSCPPSVHWSADSLEKDLYIESTTVTVLAMDGRRRWLDIRKLGSNGKGHFMFVTNLAPCSGVRIHLWPEKNALSSEDELSASKRIIEVTSKMVNIPAGPAPRQIEPGSQTEQAPPSATFLLTPEDMRGFRFLTISVAPRPTISGRPPPAASMAVGQFFNPKEGEREFSIWSLLRSTYVQEELYVEEDHPLPLNFSFAVSLGLLPVTLSLRTAGCGIKNSVLPVQQAGDAEQSRLCKLRCFPPVALAWDATSGLHIIPNLFTETVIVDSSPAMWSSAQGTDRTIILLMVDPHCSYRISVAPSLTAAASRFVLLYSSQIIGLATAVIFFALMRQARAWELDMPIPSMLTALESNLRFPFCFLLFAMVPIIVSLVFSMISAQPLPPVFSFITVSVICYLLANGSVIILILSSQLVLYVAATVHVFAKIRWQLWEENFRINFPRQLFSISSLFSSFKVVRIIRGNPNIAVALVTIPLVCFVHPALGLIMLLLSHAFHCHAALCSFLAASFRSHAQRKESYDTVNLSVPSKHKFMGAVDPLLPLDDSSSNSPNSSRSFVDTQLEIFNYQHSFLILHLVATLMFIPSLVAWLQRIGMGQSHPRFMDSVLCVGVILHGLHGSKLEFNIISFFPRRIVDHEIGPSFLYLLAGYYCHISALASAPYRAFYPIAAIGAICFASMTIMRRTNERGETYLNRKHSHRH